MIFALVALILIVATLVAAIVHLDRSLGSAVEVTTAALDHADVRRREAEQRAGLAESELFELRRELTASGYRRYVERDVVVQCHDGRAIRGLLIGSYADSHVLAHPRLVVAGQAAQSLGGELLLPAGDVASMQHFAEAESA